MLILTRKPGESIVIDGNIIVTFLEQRGAQVRIGINAPRAVKIYRQEVYDQIKLENQAAAKSVDKQSAEDLLKLFANKKVKKTLVEESEKKEEDGNG